MRFLEHLVGPQRSERPLDPTAARALAAVTGIFYVKSFGAADDGATDDAPAIQAAISAAESLGAGIVRLGYFHKINSGLRIRKSSVHLIGYGRLGIHFNAPIPTDRKTRIVWGGSAGGTMLTIEPDGGAGTVHIDNNRAIGFSLHGQGVAAIGCQIRSAVAGEFDLYAEECTTTDFEIGVVPTLADTRDTQFCRFNLASRNLNPGGGRNLRVGNDSGVLGNVSLNIFENVDCTFNSSRGVEIRNADNNSWMQLRVLRSSGVGNAIEIHGSNNSGENCREEYFNRVTTNAPIKIFGTPSYTFAATNITIDNLDKGNSTPDPVVEAGSFVAWRTNQGSIVLQLSGGAINLPNNGLRVIDTDATHFLAIRPGSNLTANRDFTLLTGDANRTLDLSAGDAAVQGTWRVLAASAVAQALTGTTAETTLATITIPANAMGPNGMVRVTTLWTSTGNNGTKDPRVRFGGVSGAAYSPQQHTASASTISQMAQTRIANRNATNSQVGHVSGAGVGGWGQSSAVTTSAIDTTAAQDIVISGQLANAADSLTLQSYLVELLRP